jgi:hypothetical protein
MAGLYHYRIPGCIVIFCRRYFGLLLVGLLWSKLSTEPGLVIFLLKTRLKIGKIISPATVSTDNISSKQCKCNSNNRIDNSNCHLLLPSSGPVLKNYGWYVFLLLSLFLSLTPPPHTHTHTHRRQRYSFTHTWPQHWMGLGGQCHILAALPWERCHTYCTGSWVGPENLSSTRVRTPDP